MSIAEAREVNLRPADLRLVLPREKADLEYQPYVAMLQGPGSNKLAHINTRASPKSVHPTTGTATFEGNECNVYISNHMDYIDGLRVSARKLLDACVIALTEKNDYRGNGDIDYEVSIPLEEYARLLGKPTTKASIDEVRKQVKRDLNLLYNVSVEWTERKNRKPRDYSKMRIISFQSIRRGNIIVEFSVKFASYLIREAYIMQYPYALFKSDERNQSIYFLGRKLLLHRSIDNNSRKGTAGKISVRALLDDCPSIPSCEEVMNKGRALGRRIKQPFVDALDVLVSMGIISFEFVDSKGIPLMHSQVDNLSYYNFIDIYIEFDVIGFPNQSKRLEARDEEVKGRTQGKRRASIKNATPNSK